jgi:L-threonylcarbamoyladenylate synthase
VFSKRTEAKFCQAFLLIRQSSKMKTRVTDLPNEAAEILRRGGIVAFPTETVFGLGADLFNELAIEKIFLAKRRPEDNPLIVHVAEQNQITKVAIVTPTAQRLINAFFPGPITVVIPKRESVPLIATAGLDTLGVRMPNNKIAQVFLRACDTPVVAPSANLSGKPSPTTWEAVFEDLSGKIDCILKGDATEIGLESTVVDCSGEIPVLLRPGAISIDELRRVVSEIRVSYGNEKEHRSPGMRHQHYAPVATVELVAAGDSVNRTGKLAYIGLNDRNEHYEIKKLCGSTEEYAHDLFEFFRGCDRKQVETIYCERVLEIGIGVALMDRLRRASQNI